MTDERAAISTYYREMYSHMHRIKDFFQQVCPVDLGPTG